MHPMPDLQLVIFDCDGVLVDSETISNEVLARALTAQGLPTTLAQSRRDYQGLLLAEIDSRARAKLGRPLAEDWLQRYERDRTAVFRRELRAVLGVTETVRTSRPPACRYVSPPRASSRRRGCRSS
jgi:beta-phosphoglucomutase-like phosphatase (HAD superfamily)